ncbi:uracil-DNA glycosylase-like protein [Aspergillus ambiguus]|uniref:uracil-DNA glycosylase-like protein n=1 Tax=Aspergillus ambiguus TaxID=176160 RepID=UPI003CCD6D6A
MSNVGGTQRKAAYQVGSAVEGFIWPKVFWDFMTRNLNGAVKPVPILQTLNLIMGLLGLAWEWPLKYFAGSFPHRSIEFRLILYPLSALLAALLYQGTDPALYYLVGIAVYFWAYSEGEVVCPEPWTLPKRNTHLSRHDSGMSPPNLSHENDSTLSDDDVPVNKTTSFHGRLSQYFHASKNVPSDTEPPSKALSSTLKPPKRGPNPEDALTDIISQTQQHPKRRKAPAKPTPTESDNSLLPVARVTRSRSAGSTPASTHSPLSRSPTTQPTTPERPQSQGSRRRRQQSSSRTSTPPANSSISLLRDTIPPNLTLLLVGVNPGIMTGTTGFAYAHPSNLFWKLLHSSGITTIRHPPSDTYRLPELYNVGNTNIVERPTRDASMLSKAEMNAGVPVLEAKVAAQRPEAVCLVGKSIWEAVWRVRKGRAIRKEEFRYGWQDVSENMGRTDSWDGAPVFVATTTSGLAAGMTMAEKEAVWNELGSWVVSRREAMATATAQTAAE